MPATEQIPEHHEVESADLMMRSVMLTARMVGSGLLAVVTLVWIRVTIHAWHIRSLVTAYEAEHGAADRTQSPWPDHNLRALNDDLVAVGADYFYPFGPFVILGLFLAWMMSAAIAGVGLVWPRVWLLASGVVVFAGQLLVFVAPLWAYVEVTD